MNKEIEQAQRKILGIRQVYNTHHNPVLHKNDADTLFAEIDRLQAEKYDAVLQENIACARIADSYSDMGGASIAHDIRARQDKL